MPTTKNKVVALTYTVERLILDPFQTTDAAYQVVRAIPIKQNQHIVVKVEAIGSTPTFTDSVSAEAQASFLRSTGNVARTSTSNNSGLLQTIFGYGVLKTSTVDLDIVENTVGQTVDIRVRGRVGTTINWNFVINLKYTN